MHDRKCSRRSRKIRRPGSRFRAELGERANRADAFGRGLWTARTTRLHTNVSFQLHNETPRPAHLETVMTEIASASCRSRWSRAIIRSRRSIYLLGYSSAYYTYLWDKVIAEDYFGQFDRNNCSRPGWRYVTATPCSRRRRRAGRRVGHQISRSQTIHRLLRQLDEPGIRTGAVG